MFWDRRAQRSIFSSGDVFETNPQVHGLVSWMFWRIRDKDFFKTINFIQFPFLARHVARIVAFSLRGAGVSRKGRHQHGAMVVVLFAPQRAGSSDLRQVTFAGPKRAHNAAANAFDVIKYTSPKK